MARIESPFEQFPGHIEIPDWLTAAQADEWLQRGRELPKALHDAHPAYREFYTRFSLVDFHLKGSDGKSLEIDPEAMTYPSQIAFWVSEATNDLVNGAVNTKN